MAIDRGNNYPFHRVIVRTRPSSRMDTLEFIVFQLYVKYKEHISGSIFVQVKEAKLRLEKVYKSSI